MSTKSSTPGKKKSRPELRQEVASNVVALLTNPETPTAIEQALISGMGDLWNDIPTRRMYVSEAYVLSLLEAAASGKGARNDD
ncbi:MAG TPA: hypothetical protein VGN95_25270 [Pyrinomonadaceae bacterium]|nr:hypothetical protein [Pyrinomonadaceae bacterium]